MKDENLLTQLRKPLPTATRAGRKGEVYEYIPTKFVSDRLTEVFGLDWNCEIVDKLIDKGHVAVQIRLHYPNFSGTETSYNFKDAFGGAKYEEAIGLGDCLKKSASLALKKAASLIGIDMNEEEPTPATKEQQEKIVKLMKTNNIELTKDLAEKIKTFTSVEADAVITQLSSE